ncbi:hypothetical protein IKT18_01245 [Candidatus Saccharibacteria bacterium]|nr:hypothetical protein [Candidatus Saccharibacteria bacterium]
MENENNPPKIARRRLNRKSTIRLGRTIGEKREKLETNSERTAAHKKIRQRQISRIFFTILGFAAVALLLFYIGVFFIGEKDENPTVATTVTSYQPTIEIIDEDATSTGGHLSSRMKEYIGMLEEDLRALGITPTKAVIPTGSIREVDIFIEGYTGYLKTIIDRGSGVTAEDAERMLRYLASINVGDFQYIDLRIDNKAYWK